MKYHIEPIEREDLPFIHKVRHHPETLRWLHTQQEFSLEEMFEWFDKSNPKWFIIKIGDERIGYFRTSDWTPHSVKIGADLAPEFRGKGHAKAAYLQFLEKLQDDGIYRIWLEVLSDNIVAVNLYRRLGFKIESRQQDILKRDKYYIDSITMSIENHPASKCVKVIATYFGDRRRAPFNASECLPMLEKLWHCEQMIDPGVPMDTVFVCNVPYDKDTVTQPKDLEKCMDLLNSYNGKPTKRGTATVITRPNDGVSFGAYNHAFKKLNNKYTHFFFIEDDHIMIKHGYYQKAIQQLKDPAIGFVGVVKIYQRKGWKPCFCAGGVGFTTRRVLRQVERHHGKLPHFRESTTIDRAGYYKQKLHGEYRFTGMIWKLGYKLELLNMVGCCVPWGNNKIRTDRLTTMDHLP